MIRSTTLQNSKFAVAVFAGLDVEVSTQRQGKNRLCVSKIHVVKNGDGLQNGIFVED